MAKQREIQNNKKPSVKKKMREVGFISSHGKAFVDALIQFKQTPVSTTLTCFVMAMAILLTSLLLGSFRTIQGITHYLHSADRITVYLKTNLDPGVINHALDMIKSNPFVKETTYISPEEALRELRKQEGYGEVLNQVTENPLPPVIEIKLNSIEQQAVSNLVTSLRNYPAVENIHLDYEWFQRLTLLAQLFHRVSYTLCIFLSLGVIFLMTHAIQGATQRNQLEITLLQLMGASTSYIRRPFLYFGTLLGLGAGFITLFILFVILSVIKQPLYQLLQTYHLTPTDGLMTTQLLFSVLGGSLFLSLLGTWIAFKKYARMI